MRITKPLSILSLLFVVGQNSYAQKEFKTYYGLNKTKVKEVYFANAKGEKEGLYKLFDENGIIQQEANYKAGVLEGMLKEYYPLTNKACLKRTAIYKNGDVDGQTTYYESECNVITAQGNCSRYYLKEGVWVFYKKIDAAMPEGFKYITYTQTFQADKLVSESDVYYYHPSKKIYSEKKGSKRISYSPEGKIIGEETYDQNGATVEEKVFYLSNGKLGKHTIFSTSGNIKIEEYNEWFENGNVRLKKKLENGETVVFEEYDIQGNPTTNMNWYKKDIADRQNKKPKQGKKKYYYDEDWKPVKDSINFSYYRIIEYKDNKPTGLVKDYYKSGELQGESFLISEDPDVIKGTAKNYYKNGKLSIVANYNENGQLNGPCINYYENGKIKDSTTYVSKSDYHSGKSYALYSVNFDENGYKTSEMNRITGITFTKQFHVDPSLEGYNYSMFDKSGKITMKSAAFVDNEGEIKFVGNAQYFDEKGNVIKTETYDSQGNLMK